MAGVGVVLRVAALAVAWVVYGIALAGAAQAQDDLTRLRAEVSRLHGQGKYAQAAPIAQRYVELARQKHGEEHPEFATAISWLASVYYYQGRYAEAEPLYRRSLAIYEKASGPEHPDVGASLNNLAALALAQRDWGRGADYWRRSAGIITRRAERGLAGASEGSSKGRRSD